MFKDSMLPHKAGIISRLPYLNCIYLCGCWVSNLKYSHLCCKSFLYWAISLTYFHLLPVNEQSHGWSDPVGKPYSIAEGWLEPYSQGPLIVLTSSPLNWLWHRSQQVLRLTWDCQLACRPPSPFSVHQGIKLSKDTEKKGLDYQEELDIKDR